MCVGSPLHALDPAFDRNHDSKISRAEWGRFTCADCVVDSVCQQPSANRACHDCSSFDALNAPFRYSVFDTAYASGHADDDYLRRDELWQWGCNFFASLTSITTIDPHLLLVVFLPPLLFESAYAMDIAIFWKQFSQIALLAIPGVVLASLLTACVVWGLYPNWQEFNFAWYAPPPPQPAAAPSGALRPPTPLRVHVHVRGAESPNATRRAGTRPRPFWPRLAPSALADWHHQRSGKALPLCLESAADWMAVRAPPRVALVVRFPRTRPGCLGPSSPLPIPSQS